MDIRSTLFSSHQESPLEKLPMDLQLEIATFLCKEELPALVKLQRSNKNLNRIFSKNDFWIKLYQENFGPIAVTTDLETKKKLEKDAEAQFIASYLFEKANACKRHDIAQIHFIKLYEFLSGHLNKIWAQYFIGLMKFHGKGIARDEKAGLEKLRESFDEGDYRAALKIASLLMSNEYNNQFKYYKYEAVQDFSYDDLIMQKLVETLKASYKQGIEKSAHLLGLLYQNSLLKDKDEAEFWFVIAMENTNCSKSVSDLITLKFLKIPDINNDEEISCTSRENLTKILLYTAELLQLNLSSHTIVSEIFYHIILIYHHLLYKIHHDSSVHDEDTREYNDLWINKVNDLIKPVGLENADLEEYTSFFQNSGSQSALGKIYYENHSYYQRFYPNNNQFLESAGDAFLVNASALGDENAPIFLAFRTQDNVPILKGHFVSGNNFAAHVIALFTACYEINFREETEKRVPPEILYTDPKKVWWLQLSTQCGCKSKEWKLDELSEELIEPYPFLHCALGIIYTFGILGSDFMADKAKAQEYFSHAKKLDPDALQVYLQVGKEEGVLHPTIEKVLQEQIDIDLENRNNEQLLSASRYLS